MVSSRPDYLSANEGFYRTFWHTTPNYGSPFPNAEEGARGSVVLSMLARLAEQEGWASHRPRILDAGCGRGWLTNLVSVFGRAEGCEPVAGAVALARTLFPTLSFHAATPGELAAARGFVPFDVVVCSEVLEHVPSELQSAFISDLHACLRPGGTLVLTTPRGELQQAQQSPKQLLELWRTEAEVERLLLGSGFIPLDRRRACPTGGTLLERIIRRLPEAMAQRLRASWLQAAIDHRRGLYQIWCCRRG